MRTQADCECGSVLKHIGWLDKRNAVRTAYLALLAQGQLPPQDGLANSISELRALTMVGAKTSGFITTKDDLWAHLESKAPTRSSCLTAMAKQDQEDFASKVQFIDYRHNGSRYKHVGSWYHGDLLAKHGLPYVELFKVASLFGIGAQMYLLANNRFGCEVDPGEKCQPRDNFNCPFAADC